MVRGAAHLPVLRFFQALLVLIGIALAVGFLIWLFERRHNEGFGGGVVKGLGTSFW